MFFYIYFQVLHKMWTYMSPVGNNISGPTDQTIMLAPDGQVSSSWTHLVQVTTPKFNFDGLLKLKQGFRDVVLQVNI